MRRGPAPSSPSSAALDAGSALLLMVGLFGCLLCALGVVGCTGREVRVELFEITSLGPDRIEAGRRIELEGRGFPVGADASLVLTGTLHQPGVEEPVEISVPMEIDTAEHAEGLVTGAFLDALGPSGRGTFRGSATLLVPMADADGSVSGTLPGVVLDLRPNRLELEDEPLGALDLAAWLELELTEDPELGLRVATISPEGPAARMGVLEGDALLGIDGMRVASLSDLEGWTERPARLEVDRGRGGVELSAHPPAEIAPDASLRAFQLGLLLIVVMLTLRERDRPSEGKRRVSVSMQGLALIAVSLALVQLGVHRLSADRLPMLLAPVFAAVVIASSATGHALRSPWVVASGFARALVLLAVVLVAGLQRGTMDLGELARAQALLPTEWSLLATPAAPAFVLLLALGLPPAAPTSAGVGTRILNRATEISVSALVVLCMAGGRGDATALGTGLFVLRGVVIFGGLWWTRAVLHRLPLRVRGLSVIGALGWIAATSVWVVGGEASAGLGRASAELWLAALAVAVVLQLRPRAQAPLQAELAL